MVKYDAKTLERQFKSAASMRIRKKERGNNDYTNDAGYWDGGRCNWGGSHNLSQDCETIAKGFSKLDELKTVEKELQQCTSEQEFNSTKSRLARQAEEIESELQARTGSTSSMFGICIIWGDYDAFLESKLRPLRSEVSRLKGSINNQQYKYYEEIKLLRMEQKQIEARMKENKQKAANEKDPNKRTFLLQLIEDDGKLLKENLEKQKAIPVINLKFEPDKYVNDLINAMKEAIKNSGGDGSGGNGGSGRNKNKNDDDDKDDDNGNGSDNTGSGSGSGKKEDKNKPQDFFQENKQLIIITGFSLLVIFYLLNNKDKDSKSNDYLYDF